MLNRCQNKFAFSKLNWYISALKINVPKRILISTLTKCQYRTTTLLESTIPDKNIEISTTVLPSVLVPPLDRPTQLNSVQLVDPREYRHCSGFNKHSGQQCKYILKVDPSIPLSERMYCYRHYSKNHKDRNRYESVVVTKANRLKKPTKLKRNKATPSVNTVNISNKLYDCWNLWIAENIKDEQRALIRQEIQKPISKREKSGYIYAYLHDEDLIVSEHAYAYFKIGRTTDPHRRMYQIHRDCQYIPKIIELFPSFPEPSDTSLMENNLEPLKHKLDELPKCPLSHRVERLIHLELSSLYQKVMFTCPKCGKKHREWFRVKRTKHPDGRLMTDQELWLLNIRPVILRWIQFGVLASELKRI
ncbi:meiotically up-regulated gene 113-domain-containing protein [Cokeromyces recurvatus]|uniref:meiotically up-regulated gene 113-domain-containing protein n=1 Tax=Cokeromyces recurvatus TaxID=90255 RepID=UPI002220C4D4|nr:meiotically up-regulated gene 113-domain-containing protein [Cokeromyces recurvatus]KAI7907254.1 meiotically up-regulated gene 113-domain-containing protein [Cokeromyces recurvatus]